MKKLLFPLLAVILLGAVIIGASLAFFSDEVSSKGNVIASGSIHIKQHGSNIDGSELLSGSYITKTVQVENTGTNPAYIRTCIAVPNGGSANTAASWITVEYPGSESWEKYPNITVKDTLCDVYVITYKTPLAPAATTEAVDLKYQVSPALDLVDGKYSMVVEGKVQPLDLPEELKIWVATEAVQTTTFENANEALETVFGNIADGDTPWSWDGASDPLDADTYIPNTVIYGETETTAP